MQHLVLILLLLSTTLSLAQEGRYKPFKMIIISPDTAIVDDELNVFKDTVESAYLKKYYNSIKRLEDMVNFTGYPENMKKEFEESKARSEENLKIAKQLEPEVRRFRYFETIPIYSSMVLEMYYNEYPPNSIFQVVRTKDLKSTNLKEIASTYNADYVVNYKNIHTKKKSGLIIMKVTTTLYASRESKNLFEKETTGDVNSYGDLWTCSNPLSCLLVTCVKSSTAEIIDAVDKRQGK